jgi:hypothetical protein
MFLSINSFNLFLIIIDGLNISLNIVIASFLIYCTDIEFVKTDIFSLELNNYNIFCSIDSKGGISSLVSKFIIFCGA